MAMLIRMPQLSPTMETGVLLKWTKKEGDKIMPGDVIAEVETDKANMDFPLEDEGVLLKLLVKEGETVKLGAPVAVLGEQGEDPASAIAEGGAPAAAPAPVEKAAAAPAQAAAATEAPAAAEAAPAEKAPPPAQAAAAPAQAAAAPAQAAAAPAQATAAAAPAQATAAAAPAQATATPAPKKEAVAATRAAAPSAPATSTQTQTNGGGGTLHASPVARKLARESDVDLRTVVGTGPHGRVIKRDVEAAAVREPAPTAPATPAAPAAPVEKSKPAGPVFQPGVDVVTPLSPMRRTIARRLTEAKATVPHFYVTMDARVDALWDFHQQIKSESDEKISINDLILKGVAVALRRLPEANASYSEEGIVRHGRVDLGIAVSIEDGLVTPVLRNADQKSLGTIARETRDLIERARARKLRPDEFTGGTFSVSNMGMYGVKSFSAVINPPEGGILAVGAIEKRAIVVTDEDGSDRFEARRMMSLTVSADHRVVDGALAARLVGEIVKVLERPLSLVL